jgi:hypothetical protein
MSQICMNIAVLILQNTGTNLTHLVRTERFENKGGN